MGARDRVLTHWSVVKTLPGFERRAVQDITELGFRVLFPRLAVDVPHYGRTIRQLRPLFPGYILVELGLDDEWVKVHRLRNRNRFLLGSHGAPAGLLQAEMDRLLNLAPDGVMKPVSDPARNVQPGDAVRFTGGPMIDWTGVCEWRTDQRVGVLMRMFGEDRVVPTLREHVTAA
jgi:transcriptional antiterminator RfaH